MWGIGDWLSYTPTQNLTLIPPRLGRGGIPAYSRVTMDRVEPSLPILLRLEAATLLKSASKKGNLCGAEKHVCKTKSKATMLPSVCSKTSLQWNTQCKYVIARRLLLICVTAKYYSLSLDGEDGGFFLLWLGPRRLHPLSLGKRGAPVVAISHSFSFVTCRITSYTCIQTFHFSCLSP